MKPLFNNKAQNISEDKSKKDKFANLNEALKSLGGDSPAQIPWIVRFLENPESPFCLPGEIDLYRHDCLHILLNRGFSLYDEAFVVGFTMGNDARTNRLHLGIFKLASRTIYPRQYRFKKEHLKVFDLGVAYGKFIESKNLNKADFKAHEHGNIDTVRSRFGIEQKALKSLLEVEKIVSNCF